MAIKDRNDRTAWLAVLEGIALAILKDRVAALDDAGKSALRAEIAANVTAVCAEISDLAPTSGVRGKLSPAAAKAAAARIAGSAVYLCNEFLDEFVSVPPGTPKPAAAQPAPSAVGSAKTP